MIEVRQEPAGDFADYATVAIGFEVREVMQLVGGRLEPRAVVAPWIKDYDADPSDHPSAWPARFDVSRWCVLAAWDGARRVGGATVAWPGTMLDVADRRADTAVLWDLRVAPDARGRAVGRALFAAAEQCALDRGARRLVVETQNVNVPACRFYAAMGCALSAVRTGAYATLPDEVQLLWEKPLAPVHPG